MTHLFALLAINSLFITALYSPDNVARRSLFNASGMIAFAYSVYLVFSGFSWLFAAVAAALIGVESLRRGRGIQNEYANRQWIELQVTMLVVVVFSAYIQELTDIILQATLLVVFTFAAVVFNLLMRRHVRRHSFKPAEPLEEYPTVSLLIPARNEDHALKETLELALASDYPKLEILVLDDCSSDDTPDIIRSFAHKGVRFVEGQPLTGDWLGKNFALEQLRTSANGDIQIYADVDIQLQSYTIRELVTYMVRKNLAMVSVLPARRGFDIIPMAVRPLYNFAITLAPFGALKPARAFGSLFAITQEVSQSYSFDQAKSKIISEQHIATKLKTINKYESIIGDWALGATIRKRLNSQFQAQHRTLYPLLGSSTSGVALYSLGLLALAILPFAFLPPLFALGIYALNVAAYIQYLAVHSPQSIFLAPFQFGILLLIESASAIYSLVSYSFSELAWKDRRICLVPQNRSSAN